MRDFMRYEGLDALLREDPAAKKYFDTLPAYVREQISQRAENVNSFMSLRDYAENLTRGDG